MEILVLVLNKTEYLEDILDSFVNIGITGATIVDSQGMGSALTDLNSTDAPFYGVLKSMLDDARPYNKTIFTVVDDKKLLEKAVQSVKEIVGDMHKPGVGIMFSMPVGSVYGVAWADDEK